MAANDEDQIETEYVALEIPLPLEGTRLDRAVSMLTGCSRSRATSEIEAGRVRVGDDAVTSKSHLLRGGEVVEVPEELLDEAIPATLEADPEVEVRVVYADESLIVVDKLPGQVVHPGVGNSQGTLIAGVISRFEEVKEVGNPQRPGVVHRLDRPTSGLLVIARNAHAFEDLSAQMREHSARRTYLALVEGRIEPARADLEGSIAKSRKGFGAMALSAQGRYARTSYSRLAVFELDHDSYSLLRVELETGRTHQIRVHLSAHGFPVYGDSLYGASDALGERIFLHAWKLAFTHPDTGEVVVFSAPLPADLTAVLERARLSEGSLEALDG